MFREFLTQRIKRGLVRRLNNLKIARKAREVVRKEPLSSGAPFVFFKASTGIDDLSWNSGFHLLASWALRLRGIPVVYFACHSGMSKCVRGTNRDDPYRDMPCRTCVYQSKTLYKNVSTFQQPALTGEAVSKGSSVPTSAVHWFDFQRDTQLADAISNLSLQELMNFEWQGTPLGTLCLPGLRWILRIHHLSDDENTRFLLREYMMSAWNVARKFSKFLDETSPRAVILFNGQFFPEATARWVAQQRGIRVITHEVGLQPASRLSSSSCF